MILENREQIDRLINWGGATNGQTLVFDSAKWYFKPATLSTTIVTADSGSPIWVVTPTALWDRYIDNDTQTVYTAIWLTDADWIS